MVKLWTMSISCALQLSLLMSAGCVAHCASSPGDPSPSQDPGEVPASHLRTLSLSLAHMLQRVEENTKEMEHEEQQMVKELDLVTMNLESLREHSIQTARAHRQVRKDVQMLRVNGDKLWQAVRDLQRQLVVLKSEQGAMQDRVYKILLKVKSMAELSSEAQIQHNVSSVMKIILDKQTQQLNNLTLEVSAQGGVIGKQQTNIDYLEKQVSEGL